MSNLIQYYLDEHVHSAIAEGLRLRHIDVMTTAEANMLSKSDPDQLQYAIHNNRVLFTQDDDFIRIHASGIEHNGIIYTHQRTSIGTIIRNLTLIHQIISVEEMKNTLEYL